MKPYLERQQEIQLILSRMIPSPLIPLPLPLLTRLRFDEKIWTGLVPKSLSHRFHFIRIRKNQIRVGVED